MAFEALGSLRGALSIDRNGDLVLRSGTVEIRQPKPEAWQEFEGRRHSVRAAYRLDSAHHVRFRVGPYDHARALIIDPVLVFDTGFGGSLGSVASAIALPALGKAWDRRPEPPV